MRRSLASLVLLVLISGCGGDSKPRASARSSRADALQIAPLIEAYVGDCKGHANPSGAALVPASLEDGKRCAAVGTAEVTGDDVTHASALGTEAHLVVELRLNKHGKRALRELTTKYLGERIAMVVHGAVPAAPVVQNPISDGRTVIVGLSADDARHLVRELGGSASRSDRPEEASPPEIPNLEAAVVDARRTFKTDAKSQSAEMSWRDFKLVAPAITEGVAPAEVTDESMVWVVLCVGDVQAPGGQVLDWAVAVYDAARRGEAFTYVGRGEPPPDLVAKLQGP